MDVKNLVMAVVGMVLAAVMIGGALLPAVTNAIDEESEKINNATDYYRSAIESEQIQIVGDRSGALSINGVTYVMSGTLTQILISDQFDIYMNSAGRIVISNYYEGNAEEYESVKSFDITVSDKIVNGTFVDVNDVSHTVGDLSVSWCFVYTTDSLADWAFVTASSNPMIHINDLSQVYLSSYNATTDTFFSVNGTNVLVNGETGLGEIEYNLTKVDGYTNYYRFGISSTNPQLTITIDDNEPVTFRPYYFIVPNEISVISESNYPAVALFSAIPIIAVAGLIMAGIYVFISRK